MKKILFARYIICVAVMVFTSRMYAQQSDTAFEYNYQSPVHPKAFATNSQKSFLENSRLTEIKIKVVRHFIKSFEQAENVHWYQTDNGVVAYFTMNGIKTRAVYDKKGNCLYKIRSYAEANLPNDVKEQIKRMFCDFNITWVNEITNSLHLAYIVQIEDKAFLKYVRVCEGELEVDNDYVKQ